MRNVFLCLYQFACPLSRVPASRGLRQGNILSPPVPFLRTCFFPAAFPVRVEGSDGQIPVELTEGEDAVVLPAVFDEAVDIVIAEADAGRVLRGVAEVRGSDVGPDDGAEAHGTGVARGVDLAPREIARAEVPAGVAYGLDLGVAGRILSGQNPVVPAADNFPVLHDDGAEGTSLAAFQIAAGLLRCTVCLPENSGVYALAVASSFQLVVRAGERFERFIFQGALSSEGSPAEAKVTVLCP